MAMVEMRNIGPFVDSVPLLDEPERLREKAREEGCLFFKSLIEPQAVMAVRRQTLKVCRDHGCLDKDAPLIEGVANGDMPAVVVDGPEWQAFYGDVLGVRDFHALAQHPALIDMLERLFAEKVLPHGSNIFRGIFPNSPTVSTPPHQDHFYIGSSEETWTAWMPLGDCPVNLGGLAVVPGSHRQGLLEVHNAQGAGGHGVDVEEESTWMGGDFLCGDVLIFHSHLVHQGRDNLSADLLRLSVDYRYQPASHPIRQDLLQPHMGWVTWEEAYAGWPADDPIKYYWKKMDIKILPPHGNEPPSRAKS